MPFGKHKGEPLDRVPNDYLEWFVRNCRVGAGFRRQLENELANRALRAAGRMPLPEATSRPAPRTGRTGIWLIPVGKGNALVLAPASCDPGVVRAVVTGSPHARKLGAVGEARLHTSVVEPALVFVQTDLAGAG